MSEQQRNDPCACGSGKKYKKCCYLTIPAPKPGGVYLTDADRQVFVDEGIAKQGGRRTDPNAVYSCWLCSAETSVEPTDADGYGGTGMLWPPYCRGCCTHDKALPVRIEAFQARFPGVPHALAAESVHSLVNQAYYRMLARRGWDPGSPPTEA